MAGGELGNKGSVMSRVEEAQAEISAVLAKLEADTKQIVREITIQNIDVTTIGDKEIRRMRSVRIFMERIPGSQWA